jgi:protein-disulfide isomerase
VRLGYQHFAFLGAESQSAGEASECAADQDAFWEYHDKLFDSQSGENLGAFNKDNLTRFAVELGLDTQAFDECLDSGKYTSIVQTETQSAQSLGVRSTPPFDQRQARDWRSGVRGLQAGHRSRDIQIS